MVATTPEPDTPRPGFTALVAAHSDAIFAYLARRVGPVLAEDLTAEVFLVAYRSDEPASLPWLYGVATNLLRAHRRSEQRRLDVLARLAAQRAFTPAGQRPLEESVSAALAFEQVAASVAALPADWRDTVLLVGVEGLTYQQAASALGVPVGTVRSRLSRARHQLRATMASGASTGAPGSAGLASGASDSAASDTGVADRQGTPAETVEGGAPHA